MKKKLIYFLFIINSMQIILGSLQKTIKPTNSQQPSASATITTEQQEENNSSISSSGIFFQGLTENGVKKNTFLCGNNSATKSNTSGKNFQDSDCDISSIQNAIGFDISGGRQLQFFNNFTYWLKKKSQTEQFYQINDSLQDDALDSKMQSEGWSEIGAFCIIISTNQILQDTIFQSQKANTGETKVIVQLLYNGDNLIQLWSQDATILKEGQSFTIAITNASDDRLKSTFAADPSSLSSYLSAISKNIQPDNRNSDSYNNAEDSPRTVRIQILQ